MKNVAVIMAHPDDEVLGCGATISRLSREGLQVHILILATGLTSRGTSDEKSIRELQENANLAASCLGAKSIRFESFPDNKMDSVPLLKIIKKIENFLTNTKPDIIFTHHHGDVNIDHTITQRAVLSAARSLPGGKIRELYASEVLSSSEFGYTNNRIRPDCYFILEEKDIVAATDALSCYKTEIREWPHPRSIKAMKTLYNLRGSECGFFAAETFEILKIIK